MFIRAEGPRKARSLNNRDGSRDVYRLGGPRAEGPRKARSLNNRDGSRDVYKGGGSSKSQVLK